jgi:Alkylmercury lyase
VRDRRTRHRPMLGRDVVSAPPILVPAAPSPSAAVCCRYVIFFYDAASATSWAQAHPEVIGLMLSQVGASRTRSGRTWWRTGGR